MKFWVSISVDEDIYNRLKDKKNGKIQGIFWIKQGKKG